ncbi:hypothetical protein [Dethiosulfatarculus sandiegensis]|uniref:Uncharacterized protein n=1 Tax=Dethiosulfatarculus sandiegensis TaxID=1429043 RepID=A0A0D2JA74_9BACT|nr:hypothetical protein [Dethiosulfatarculus sandiegensis]KIX15029.1 hypothetical protein X474_05650 [Dethiosulfatarculus sandiegensis]
MAKFGSILKLAGLFLIVLFVGYLIFSPSTEELLASARDSSEVTKEYAPQIKHYCRWVDKINSRAVSSWEAMVSGLRNFEGGAISIDQLQGMVSKARYESGRAKDRFLKLDSQLPDGLSSELKALCRQINEFYFGAYRCRENAAESLSDFLEARDPDDRKEFKAMIGDAVFFARKAQADLLAAREKVGIN